MSEEEEVNNEDNIIQFEPECKKQRLEDYIKRLDKYLQDEETEND